MVEGLAAFLLAAVALAGSPGPATLSLTATGAAFGPRRGAAYLAGIVVGMMAVMDIVAKMAVLVLIITAVNVAWLFAGAALTRLFRRPHTNRAINIAFAALLV